MKLDIEIKNYFALALILLVFILFLTHIIGWVFLLVALLFAYLDIKQESKEKDSKNKSKKLNDK